MCIIFIHEFVIPILNINKSADINHVEYLWKKRFLLNRSPLEQIVKRLENKKEWEKEEDTFYNIYNPEFTVTIEDDDDDLSPEFYSYAMYNESTLFQFLKINYFGTKLYSQQVVALDGGRYLTNTPEWGFLYFSEHKTQADYSFKYFIEEKIEYKLNKFLYDETNSEKRYARERFFEVVLLFNSRDEKEKFLEHVHVNKGIFIENITAQEGAYSWIESNNKFLQDKIVTQLKTGKALNRMLNEFRTLCS